MFIFCKVYYCWPAEEIRKARENVIVGAHLRAQQLVKTPSP